MKLFTILFLGVLLNNSPTEREVIATIYHAVPAQTDSTPLVTASGFKINPLDPYSDKIIAVSRDLRKHYPYGSVVSIKGAGNLDGLYRVEDTMNKRFTGRIDILINQDMGVTGYWENVTIKLF